MNSNIESPINSTGKQPLISILQPQQIPPNQNKTYIIFIIVGILILGVLLIVIFSHFFNKLIIGPKKNNLGDNSTPTIQKIVSRINKNEPDMLMCKTRLAAILPPDPGDNKISQIEFSDDCQKVAYIYEEDTLKNIYVVINGVKQKSYSQIENFSFSPDGKRYLYNASVLGSKGWSYILVVDGIEGMPHDEIGEANFNSDNSLIMFQTTTFSADNSSFQEDVFITNGKEEKKYTKQAYPLLQFSNAYNEYYVNQYLAMHGIENKQYPVEHSSRLFISPDHKLNVYGATDEKYNPIIIENGNKVATYTPDYGFVPNDLVFSPDSTKYVYTLKRDTNEGNNNTMYRIVINGKAGKEYNAVTLPVYSPDNKDVYYLGDSRAHTFLVKNNTEIKPIAGEPEFGFNTFSISPDGSKLAYELIINNKNYLIVNNTKYDLSERQLLSDSISPVFSPDSSKIAYITSEGDKMAVTINGVKQGKAYDDIYKLKFSSNNKKIIYAAKLGNQLWWIVDTIK